MDEVMDFFETCECCSIRYDRRNTKVWGSLGDFMCPDCCSNRCDAFPGTCWNKE